MEALGAPDFVTGRFDDRVAGANIIKTEDKSAHNSLKINVLNV